MLGRKEPFSRTPGDLLLTAATDPQPAASKNTAAAGVAATRTPDRDVMRSSVPDGQGPVFDREPLAGECPRGACRLSRERELDLEGVVDLDRLPAQQRRRVPAVLEGFDHGAVHEGEALHHPAIAHHALGADHALDDHQAFDLPLQRLRGVLRVGSGELRWRGHRIVELDGAGPATDLSADLSTHHATHHSTDHTPFDAAFDALVLLDLRLDR